MMLTRLQELAGIKLDELEIADPNLYKKAAALLCHLEIGIEFCDNGNLQPDIISRFNIPTNNTDYFNVNEFNFPIKSLNDLKYQILNSRLINPNNKLNELEIAKPVFNILPKLKEIGFGFDDGLLGGVGSGGGGYYDSISDKISGFHLDKFDINEFNNWYDNFTLDSFNSNNQIFDEDEAGDWGIDYNELSKIKNGWYGLNFGNDEDNGAFFIKNNQNGEIETEIYSYPALSSNDDETFIPFINIRNGRIIKTISKNEVIKKLQENINSPGSWGII